LSGAIQDALRQAAIERRRMGVKPAPPLAFQALASATYTETYTGTIG